MGPTLTKVTTNTRGTTDCTKDADCYAASTVNGGSRTEATTDAVKKLRCCMYYELVKPSDNDLGKVVIDSYTTRGISMKENTYTKACNTNYPASFTNFADVGKYDSATGKLTGNSTYGNAEIKLYCDGGAAALAVASAAVAAITISLN